MISRDELLDPLAVEKMSEQDKKLVEDAQHAGFSPHRTNAEKITPFNHAGALQQTLNPSAIKAAECGAPGCDSDISDGIATLREHFK